MDDGDDAPVHPLRKRIDQLGFEGDPETARRLAEEGRQTVDRQLEALDDIDTKAISILKLDLVIVSALLAIGSFTADVDSVPVAALNNHFNAVAVASLVCSAALAATTYTASDSEVGMDGRSIRDAIDADLTESEFDVAVAQSYAAWIEFNDRTNVLNVPLITLTTFLVVVAIVHLALGTYTALGGRYVTGATAVAWTFLFAVGTFAGLPRQVARAVAVVSADDWGS